ncbi:MAG TPA: MmgE/PrpD family protein [Paraburkholderia sp.]
MHETAHHSAVSDALTSLACGPLDAGSATAVDAAKARVAAGRALGRGDGAVATQLAALLQPQGGSASDLRVRAWTLGATLASARIAAGAGGAESGGASAGARTGAATPDIPVLAVAITVGDATGASEADIAQAAAIGIEAAARVLAAVDSSEFRARWNTASAIGLLGATLAASRLYGLDVTRARHALGVAATQAAGLAHNVSLAIGALETGKAGADAIEAALLAKHGFTSAPASIDGRRGLAALMAYRFDARTIIEGIGSRWISV